MGRHRFFSLGVLTALLQISADAFVGGQTHLIERTGSACIARNALQMIPQKGIFNGRWGRWCRFQGGKERRKPRMDSSGLDVESSASSALSPSSGKSSPEGNNTSPHIPGNGNAAQASVPLPKEASFEAVDRGERASFSLFRCDAYHCERELVEDGKISFSAPATTQVMMRWNERPRRALVLLKPDDTLLPLCAQTVDFLQREMGLIVMVEAAAVENVDKALREFLGDKVSSRELQVFHPPSDAAVNVVGVGEDDAVDFVVTLGGDGLLMYSNSLFRRSVPPHLCFNLGSMGFLTPFEYDFMKSEIRRIMTGGVKVSLRMRLSARIHREGQMSRAFHALNEIVIDRGSSPYLTNLECYCDDQHVTTVQADGLIIATPTGSTAYSMSAGGSMVHPSVPAILFTPICPHSLSFRPIVFPDSVLLRLDVPSDARAEGRVSFDGKLSQPFQRGDSLVIKTSNFPVPTICKDDSTADWFSSLDNSLGFNSRMRQKAFDPPSMENVQQRSRNDDRIGY